MEGRRSCACTAPPARAGGNGGRRRGGSGGGVLLAAGGAPPSPLLPCGLPLSLVPPFPRLTRARPVAESSCAGALSPRRSRCPPHPSRRRRPRSAAPGGCIRPRDEGRQLGQRLWPRPGLGLSGSRASPGRVLLCAAGGTGPR